MAVRRKEESSVQGKLCAILLGGRFAKELRGTWPGLVHARGSRRTGAFDSRLACFVGTLPIFACIRDETFWAAQSGRANATLFPSPERLLQAVPSAHSALTSVGSGRTGPRVLCLMTSTPASSRSQDKRGSLRRGNHRSKFPPPASSSETWRTAGERKRGVTGVSLDPPRYHNRVLLSAPTLMFQWTSAVLTASKHTGVSYASVYAVRSRELCRCIMHRMQGPLGSKASLNRAGTGEGEHPYLNYFSS